MNRRNHMKQNKDISGTITKVLFGFFIPFVTINGLILFLFIQTPKIIVLDTDAKDYEENKIKFYIESALPTVDIKTFFEEQEIPYTKFGFYYIIDSTNNGTYEINVKSLNGAVVNSYINIETIDSEPPIINTSDASISGGLLSVTISDSQTGINYDNIYGINEDQSTVEPSYIDKASGTVQFKFDDKKKLTIHVEDNYGNSSEATFNAG